MTRTVTMAAALAVLAMACGGGGGSTIGPAGVDRGKQVSAVTEDEKGALCDWFAPMVGDYGAAPICTNPNAGLNAPPDKATCITDFPSCTVTIGQFEDCVVAVVAAEQACTDAALIMAIAKPECQAAGVCFN